MAKPTTDKEQKQAVDEPMEQEQPMTLPRLLSSVTYDLLEALQGNDVGAKQRAIKEGTRRMRIWYDAQPIEERKELAKLARKTLENFKLVSEQFFQEMMQISAQDVQ
jgi:hypothetical protein